LTGFGCPRPQKRPLPGVIVMSKSQPKPATGGTFCVPGIAHHRQSGRSCPRSRSVSSADSTVCEVHGHAKRGAEHGYVGGVPLKRSRRIARLVERRTRFNTPETKPTSNHPTRNRQAPDPQSQPGGFRIRAPQGGASARPPLPMSFGATPSRPSSSQVVRLSRSRKDSVNQRRLKSAEFCTNPATEATTLDHRHGIRDGDGPIQLVSRLINRNSVGLGRIRKNQGNVALESSETTPNSFLPESLSRVQASPSAHQPDVRLPPLRSPIPSGGWRLVQLRPNTLVLKQRDGDRQRALGRLPARRGERVQILLSHWDQDRFYVLPILPAVETTSSSRLATTSAGVDRRDTKSHRPRVSIRRAIQSRPNATMPSNHQ